jgi:hypothetical protein
VRPWLAVIGVIFLTLGVGLASTLYLGAQGTVTSSTFDTAPIPFLLSPNESESLTLPGANGTTESFQLVWTSALPIRVTLGSPKGCAGPAGPCWNASTLVTWASSRSGQWSGAGPFHYPLICTVVNPGADGSNVTVASRSAATSTARPSVLFEVVLGTAAAALFIVGGLGVFLATFLRADPYGEPLSLGPRSAEDLEDPSAENPRH